MALHIPSRAGRLVSGNHMRSLLDLLAPRRCRLCQVPIDHDRALCQVCRGELQPNESPCGQCGLPLPPAEAAVGPRRCPECLARPPPFSAATIPYCYDAALAYLIGRWKYHGERALGRSLAQLWLEGTAIEGHAAASGHPIDLLLPVPLHWRRELLRGFNQSAVLATELGLALDIPACPRRPALRRPIGTLPQARSGRAARMRNLRGVFALRGDVRGLRVALIDDVCTTGATAAAAATVLRQAGAAEVQLWCIARTPEVQGAAPPARATLAR